MSYCGIGNFGLVSFSTLAAKRQSVKKPLVIFSVNILKTGRKQV